MSINPMEACLSRAVVVGKHADIDRQLRAAPVLRKHAYVVRCEDPTSHFRHMCDDVPSFPAVRIGGQVLIGVQTEADLARACLRF